MATTVTGTRPLTKTGIGGGPKPRGPNGNGGPKRNGHDRRFPELCSRQPTAIASGCGWGWRQS